MLQLSEINKFRRHNGSIGDKTFIGHTSQRAMSRALDRERIYPRMERQAPGAARRLVGSPAHPKRGDVYI